MEVVTDRPYEGKPIPATDAVSAPFFEAAAEGRLLYQRCRACGHAQFYPRALCTACGATPEWAEASGRGHVHTFTIVRQYGAPPFAEELPYLVAIIDLEEGVRMMGNVTDIEVDVAGIGMPVEAYALKVESKLAIPYWRPRHA